MEKYDKPGVQIVGSKYSVRGWTDGSAVAALAEDSGSASRTHMKGHNRP